MDRRPLHEIVLERIDAFLEEMQMSDWKLGKMALHDNKAVWRIRCGEDIKLSTVTKLEAYMAAERARVAETVELLNLNDADAEMMSAAAAIGECSMQEAA